MNIAIKHSGKLGPEVSGIATATVNNLNPHKDYKYDIKMDPWFCEWQQIWFVNTSGI